MGDIDDLLASIFEGANRALYADFEQWVRGSRPFRAFAGSYRTKIRAKLRNVRDAEGMQDLRAELRTAATLLRDQRFAVEYEKYAAAAQRGPDFTVLFKTHTPFNVEVRRIHSADFVRGEAEARVVRLVAVICDKVAQMPSGSINFLWLTADADIAEGELAAATLAIRQLAESKADAFFARFGYANAGEFLKQYQRLSGIVLQQRESIVWLNPLARRQAAHDLVLALQACLSLG